MQSLIVSLGPEIITIKVSRTVAEIMRRKQFIRSRKTVEMTKSKTRKLFTSV
jgi:hypothetical protein